MTLPLLGCAQDTPTCQVAAETRDARRGNAGCLITHAGKLLVIDHRKSGRLGLPGGTALAGEGGQCTAHRETWEETGLPVTVGRFRARLSTDFLVYDCEPATAVSSAVAPELPSRSLVEVAGLKWVDVDRVQPENWRFPDQLHEVRALMSGGPLPASVLEAPGTASQ
jgi:8-oxo-dGTP pyrophosphatase MutT (NUDIX family)